MGVRCTWSVNVSIGFPHTARVESSTNNLDGIRIYENYFYLRRNDHLVFISSRPSFMNRGSLDLLRFPVIHRAGVRILLRPTVSPEANSFGIMQLFILPVNSCSLCDCTRHRTTDISCRRLMNDLAMNMSRYRLFQFTARVVVSFREFTTKKMIMHDLQCALSRGEILTYKFEGCLPLQLLANRHMRSRPLLFLSVISVKLYDLFIRVASTQEHET